MVTGSAGLARTTPEVHFTCAEGWLNDPLGLTYHDGIYHLFYQHVPGQLTWDIGCRWGHATSPDLLHWTEHPIALSPGDGDAGCWSGSIAVPADHEAVMFYTAVHASNPSLGQVRVARPRDKSWEAWDKGDTVATVPDDVGAVVFRDPFLFKDGQRWRMLVGASGGDGTASALVYGSEDLQSWDYEGPLAQRSTNDHDPVWTGSMWECPQLLKAGDRYVLVVSVWEDDNLHYVAAAVGRYADGRFEAETWQRLSYGPGHYAASAFTDRDGNPGLIMWIRGVASPRWTGALSVPYQLSVTDGRVHLEPHRNLLEAHRRPASPDADTSAMDLDWEPGGSGAIATLRLVSGAGSMVASITAEGSEVSVTAGQEPPVRMPRAAGSIRVLVDGPVLEVCCGEAITAAAISDREQVRPECDLGSTLRRRDLS